MIYLIKVEYKDFTLAKIGYDKDIKRRMNSYITENPIAALISCREGSMEEEKLIYQTFNSGDRLFTSDIKKRLRDIYENLSLSKNPKSTDLIEFFELTKTNITTSDGIKKRIKLGKCLK